MNGEIYCPRCARLGDAASANCPHCGVPRDRSRSGRATGVAFVLNEVDTSPLSEIITAQQRARIATHYEEELRTLVRPAPEQAAPARAASAHVPAPAPMQVGASEPAAITTTPPRRPAPVRKPTDWSWLAEQQANLFLFAGAFLTVVAALIYVGYSGNAVDGSLKMALLVAYTLAFLAAGIVCLRIPRVAIAGQVFFGVGALLVPLNFVAARSVLTDESLSPETMWLAGSVTTAAFYTAVAWLGVGRRYSFGAGVAFVSATLAAVVRLDVAPEWAPICFLALAGTMACASVAGPATLRARAGYIWSMQAHVVAGGAIGFALLMAPFAQSSDVDFNISTLWYLPITFVALTAYAALPTFVHKQQLAGVALIAAFSGAVVSIVYALDVAAEEYAVAFAALAVILGAMAFPAASARWSARLPERFGGMLRDAGAGATLLAAAIVVIVLMSSAGGTERDYTIETRWFAAIAFALVSVFYVIDAVGQRKQEGVAGLALSAAALCASTIYGLDLSAEWYAVAFGGLAIAYGVLAWTAKSSPNTLRLPDQAVEIFRAAGYAATALSAVLVLVLLGSAADGTDGYQMDTRWFGAISFVLVSVFYVMDALGHRRQEGVAGFAAAMAALIAATVYGFDLNLEWYAVAFATLAPVYGALAVAAVSSQVAERLPEHTREMFRAAGYAATALSIGIVVMLLASVAGSDGGYQMDTRWFAAISLSMVLAFYLVDAFGLRERSGVSGAAMAIAALCAATVYGLDVSAEYYAFALIVPSVALGSAVLWAPASWTQRLAAKWRDDVMMLGRVAAAAGSAIALAAAIIGEGSSSNYAPQFWAFLPVAFATAAAFFAIDASRTPRAELSAALMLTLTGAIVSVAYAFDTEAAYYGAAFAVAGAIFAVGGRAWSPSWLDKDVRDMAGAGAFTIAWLAFEPAYRDEARVGAVVHLAAAAFYALAAMFQKSEVTLARLVDEPLAARVRITIGWLYAAGLVATLGYLHFLRSIPGDETIDHTLRLGYPMMVVTLAFALLGIASSRLRPEFRMHFYVMALAAALVSLTTPVSAEALATLLTVYVATSLVLAVFENEPLVAAPAGAFGFAAIAAWGARLDDSDSLAPVAFMLVALLSAAAAGASRKLPRWPFAAGVCAALYGVAAPATGFVMLASQTHDGYVGNTPFYETALYEWSTISVALVGMLALAGAAVSQRRWIIVPATAVLATALLLQIGRFDPENPQAYTLVIGMYLALLGLVGLWKFRLVPELAEAAPWIEAAGAAFIMLPSMVQSLEPGGGRYEWIVLTEAVAFFAGSIVLRRRGMLGASIMALVLVAGRVLFDAVNALPNWVVVMVAGMALLGVGMAILLGRERWSRWQEALLGWWANSADAPVH